MKEWGRLLWMVGLLLVLGACGEAEKIPETQIQAEAAEGARAVVCAEPVLEASVEPETIPEAPIEKEERLGFTDGNITAGGALCGGDDGYVYYASKSDVWYLYRAKPDGSEKTKINEDRPKYINVLDGWVYYVNLLDNDSVYRVRTDGTDRQKLVDGKCRNLRVTENGMYYDNKQRKTVYKADLQGTNAVLLAENTCVAAYHDGFLYCRNADALTKLDVDTGLWETVYEGNTDAVSVDETGIYFFGITGPFDGQGVYCHLDGDGKLTELHRDGHSQNFTYYDGTVYFTDYGGSQYDYYCLYALDVVSGDIRTVMALSDKMYDMEGTEVGVTVLAYREGLVETDAEPLDWMEEWCYHTYVAGDRLYTDACLRASVHSKGTWDCWASIDGNVIEIWD